MMMPEKSPSGPRIPVSTYRLQFNYQFTFTDARNIVPYLHELGITDIYTSPCFKAQKGSLHGYEVVDPNSLNPELGTEEEYDEFVKELRKYGMGQILDIVPNHMCIECNDNVWWTDLLENGISSPYSIFFDIDWNPVRKALENKVLIPILGDQYGTVLENQELQLIFEGGAFFISYYDHKLPVIPDTYSYILKHRIENMGSLLSADDPHLAELLSIITALNHLPKYTEKDVEKIDERYREKEVIKKRLAELFNESQEIRSFIKENIRLFNGIKGDHKSFNRLDELLSTQVWRLSHWRVATEEINYRRFFDINKLGAVRMEYAAVFNETHKLTFKLVREGKITGLRVDYIDGLYNPKEYFDKLQKNCFVRMQSALTEESKNDVPSDREQSNPEPELQQQYEKMIPSDPQFKPFYVIGEKVLTKGEKIPDDWLIYGTTGYVFLNSVNGIFVETRHAKIFDSIYSNFIKSGVNFQDTVYEKKKLVMQVSMSGEINALAHYLIDISEKNRHTRDFTLNSLIKIITEIIACFPVYRTYINSLDIKDRDRQYIETAVSKAKRRNPAVSRFIFDFLKDVLLLNIPEELEENDKYEWLAFIMKFQQITGPVMAKGLEDTAFYAFNRLISLNEVGGSPDRFGMSAEAFHGQNIERIKFWPHALITTSTHDTKRSEDVRARINVLSEMPQKWKECLTKWSRHNKKKKIIIDAQAVPDHNEEYLLYQTIIGAWPNGPMNKKEYDSFKTRIKDYMLKAIREAKINTSWINPDTVYEDSIMGFIEAVMSDTAENHFLTDFKIFQKMISGYGIYNSLSQTLLKITSPGVPDFYQGTEIWDLSLVDPDNRRPVDYSERTGLLGKLKERESKTGLSEIARELVVQKEDGMIKLFLICRALNFRKENREVFEKGDYIPLYAEGYKADNVCAFARKSDESVILVAVPRFFTKLVQQPDDLPFGEEVWKDSIVFLTFETEDSIYRNIFTDETVGTVSRGGRTVLYLSGAFANFPVALLEKQH